LPNKTINNLALQQIPMSDIENFIGLFRPLLSRLVKPAVLAAIAYLCLRFLGFSHFQSLFASLVPLVTGVANVFASVGYLVVVVTLLAAVGSSWFPSAKQDLQRMLAARQGQQEASPQPPAQVGRAPEEAQPEQASAPVGN